MRPDIIGVVSTLPERLKEALALRDVGPNEVDRACGFVPKDKEGRPRQYGAGYTSRLQNGKRAKPDPDKVAGIAKFLGVRFEWLYWGRPPRDLDAPDAPSALEAGMRESLIDPTDPVEVTIAFTRRQVSQEAIDKFRASRPSHSKPPEELRTMLLEINRDLTMSAIREANEEKKTREAAAREVAARPTARRQKKAS
jgi:hypothetical protein